MDKVYKVIEVVGCSAKSYDDAVRNAVNEAGKTLKGLAWFQVIEWRGGVKDGQVSEFQAVTKVGFRLLDE